MTEKPKATVDTVEKETRETPGGRKVKERNPLFAASRRVLLAGIGAIALAQDEVQDFVDRLVERGEIAEKDGRKLVEEIMDRRKIIPDAMEEKLGKRMEAMLDRLNVPTKTDIDTLSKKIAALSRKVDELVKEKSDHAAD